MHMHLPDIHKAENLGQVYPATIMNWLKDHGWYEDEFAVTKQEHFFIKTVEQADEDNFVICVPRLWSNPDYAYKIWHLLNDLENIEHVPDYNIFADWCNIQRLKSEVFK